VVSRHAATLFGTNISIDFLDSALDFLKADWADLYQLKIASNEITVTKRAKSAFVPTEKPLASDMARFTFKQCHRQV
jgi:hypothetical protein